MAPTKSCLSNSLGLFGKKKQKYTFIASVLAILVMPQFSELCVVSDTNKCYQKDNKTRDLYKNG